LGSTSNFKKALVDYSINNYLRNIRAPSVLFLNAGDVANSWDSYESNAHSLIQGAISYILSPADRTEARLILGELIPNSIA
jgi:hypothetical protein